MIIVHYVNPATGELGASLIDFLLCSLTLLNFYQRNVSSIFMSCLVNTLGKILRMQFGTHLAHLASNER